MDYNYDNTGLKKLDVFHDLSKGERQYLARKGITGKQFDNMQPLEQAEWKDEMRNPAYAENDKFYNSKGNQFRY